MSGFQFTEVMSGTYALASAPHEHRRFVFQINARTRSWRGGPAAIAGVLEAEGFAEEVPIQGTLLVAPLTKKIIRYEFDFVADDGKPYRFAGQKDIKFTNLRESFTTLPGVIVDAAGQKIATVETRFDLGADLFQFVSSLRPA